MKKFVTLVVIMLTAVMCYAQEASALFEQYTKEGRYTIDNGNIVVSKIIEELPGTTDDIYGRVKAYFARAYGDSKSVIQTDDKEGGLIIGKGIYPSLTTFSLGVWTIKAYHILRVDIKDGRARIICSASSMIPNSSAHPGNEGEYLITDYAPITNKRAMWTPKGAQTKAFVNLVDRMNNSITELESALKGGGLLQSEEEDW